MDGASTAATLIGLAEVAAKVIPALYKYVAAVRHAPAECNSILVELAAINGTLLAARTLIDDVSRSADATEILPAFSNLERHKEIFSGCQKTLEQILTRLAKATSANGKMKWRDRVLWPLKEAELSKFREELARHKIHITTALSLDSCRQLLEVYDSVQDIRREQRDFISQTRNKQQREDNDQLIKWFAALDFTGKHEQCRYLRRHGTGSWFLDDPAFRSWRDEGSTFLWLDGKPGSGKTILSSLVIDDLMNTLDENSPLLYYYCDFSNTESTKPARIFQSLIGQLLSQIDMSWGEEFPEMLKKAREGRGCESDLKKLCDMLRRILTKGNKKTYVVIDALDESTSREEWLTLFVDLLDHPNLRALASSRPEPDIGRVIEGKLKLPLQERVHQMRDDIDKHISESLATTNKLSRLPDGLKAEIRKVLLDQANGMFRWVQCQLDVLKGCRTAKAVRHALNNLPEGLYETYERVLRTIRAEGGDAERIAKDVLIWILCSSSPLELGQLAEAITVQVGSRALDEDVGLFDSEELLEICSGLVTYTPTTRTVVLSHFTVKEFLLSDYLKESSLSTFHVSEDEMHLITSANCLTYLLLDDFDGPSETYEDLKRRDASRPLYRYVASSCFNFVNRLKEEEPEELITELLVQLLFNSDNRPRFISFEQMRLLANGETKFERMSGGAIPREAPCQYAYRYGRSWIVPRIKEAYPDGFKESVMHQGVWLSHLSLAVWVGNIPVAKALVNAGLDLSHCNRPGMRNNWEDSALYNAIVRGNDELFVYFIEKGAAFRPPEKDHDPWESNLLYHACAYGHVKIVNALMQRGCKPQADCLEAVIRLGSVEIAKILLDAGCEPNDYARYGKPPLLRAIMAQFPAMIQLLLDHGAKVDMQVDDPKDLLAWAEQESWYYDVCEDLMRLAQRQVLHVSSDDIFRIFAFLVRRKGLPRELAARILDEAEYWVCTSVKKAARVFALDHTQPGPFDSIPKYLRLLVGPEQGVVFRNAALNEAQELQNDAPPPYTSVKIKGRKERPVQKIIFRTVSHDQGWSGEPYWHGKYAHTWTWFDATILPAGESHLPANAPQRFIQSNAHAVKEWRKHTNIWDWRSPQRDFLETLKPGDQVQVYPKARFTGWMNWVESVHVDVYTAWV